MNSLLNNTDKTPSNKLDEFYFRLFANYSVYETISKNNDEKLKFLNTERNEEEPIVIDKLNTQEEYILSFIDDRKQLVRDLFLEMHKMEFNKVDSVNGPMQYLGYNSSRKDMLKRINLYDHTINVAIITVEYLSSNGTPKDLISISLIIAILHDFGKSPIVESKYKEDGENGHDKISANFAKDYLVNYIRTNKNSKINKKIIDTVYETLYNHHNMLADQNRIFLNILIQMDRKARENELIFIRSKDNKGGSYDI